MSVINQMLKDLDARRATAEVPDMANEVRPLPTGRKAGRPVGRIIFWLLALSATAGAAYWGMQSPDTPAIPAASPAATSPVTTPPSPVAAAAPVEPSSPAPAAAPVNPPPPAVVSNATLPGLQMDFDLEAVPASPPAKPAVSEKGKKRHGKSGKTSPSSSAKLAPASPKPVSPPPSIPAVASAAPPAELPRAAPEPMVLEKQPALASARERAERLYRSAVTLLGQGRGDEAQQALRQALQEDPLHIASRQLLVRQLVEARQSEPALVVLKEGLQKQPQQLSWALLASRLLVDKGDSGEALAVLQRAEPAGVSSAEYQAASGAVLQRLARHAEAEARYIKAVQIDPGNARWWLGLGLARDAQGKPADAKEAFQRAAALKNLSPELQSYVEQKLK